MPRHKLTIAYDGTHYCGWQVQANGLSIQTLVQSALETVLRHPIGLTGSGRTDAGVHAQGQTAHFDTESSLTERCLISCNALLPPDIRILSIDPIDSHFHARYSATGKIYHYHLYFDAVMNPFVRLYRTHIRGRYDLQLIQEASTHFLGTKDFTSFANEQDKGTAAHDSIRTLRRLDCVFEQGGMRLEFEADGFLYKMVRNITGMLLEIGKGKKTISQLEEIFASKDRRQAGMAAPPQGLFLMKVLY